MKNQRTQDKKLSELKGAKILVTGAGGFIGSHLVEFLASLGAKVTAFFRYTSGASLGNLTDSPALKKIKVAFGDMRDSESLGRAVANQNYIFHLAAQIAIPYSYLSPQDFMEVNALGTTNLLMAAKSSKKLERILVASTSEVYGSAKITPMDEDHPQNPQSPYAASKLAAEKISLAMARSYEIPVTVVRPFNCYGPRQSARAIIPTIILQGLQRGKFELGSTFPKRDFSFVEDTIRGMALAAISPKTSGRTLNLCAGEEVSIAWLVKIVCKQLEIRPDIKTDHRRVRPKNSEVSRLMGDNTLATKLCGYETRVSLEDGIEQTIRYFRERVDDFRKEDYQL
ncbi:MAG: GDP-mannose 4,6-dehydratase [candidate division Zixibacteria bacterium]|nr:GDP-mannose 4,6-dehydratase [candidate division Zixibacteria bacterium]